MLKKSGNHPNRKKNGALSARRLLTIYLPQLQTVALRKHGTLRKLCEEYIKKLQSEKAAHRRIQSADPYFEPFRIAAKTKHPDTVHVALNGIQNLVAGGYLTGERMVKMSNAIPNHENKAKNEDITVPLIDIIVKTVCECADIPHSSTQLMVINTLLNLCTCGTTEIHGESLTMVIMSLYYIFLNSKDWDVQTSATATLTQTMSILFARVESVSTELTQLQDEMKLIEAQRKREQEQQRAKEEEKIQRPPSQDSNTNDEEYIMSNGIQNETETKDNDEDLSTDNDYNNAEELIEQIPLTSEDVVSSILQNMINNVTAAEEQKIKMQTEQQNKLKIVHSVIHDMIDNSLQIHVERLADAYKRRGNQEYSKQHHRTALKYYQTAHKLNPRTPIYLVNMGITHYVLAELDHSHRLCVEAVKVGKKNGAQIQWIAKAFSTLAHVAYKQQKISACIRYYRLSLREYNDPKIKRKLKEIIQEFGDATTDTNDLEFWEKVATDSNYNTPEHTPGVLDHVNGGNGALAAPRKTQSQLVALLSQLYKDCWIVLEELCKLAAKQKVDKSLLQNNQWSSFLFPKSDNDLINIRSRSLSLRLINSAMQNVGPHLSSTKKFISLIRTNLVPTLCANVTSTIESIIQMAMSIFKALVERFKHNLVSEIGVLFDSFLLLASSPNSTFQQKLEVLKVLSDICNDGHTTVSLFLNYDCSNQATRPKVFQHIISTVEHINNTKLESRDWINEEEANSLRTAALKCFVTIMQSLVDWEVTRSPNSPKTETPHSKSSKSAPLKPLAIKSSIEKPKPSSKDDADDLIRTGSLSSMNGGNVHGISPPPQEESVSLSTSEMEFPFNSNTHNYHDIFVSQKKKEETFRNGVVKFNIKPTHGVKYLVQYGLLENKPISVARFLRTTPTLDKTAVGEYIGGDKKFQIEVMHLYIDSVSFERMSFVDALRYLCSLFMLPGEAQKIDRIIERFAARYCQENTNQFSSGDVAYILAYSVILLHSNIYNDNVKKKMTRSEFIKTCKSATSEVSDPVLSDIYDNICAKEMKLKRADHDSKGSIASSIDVSPSKKMMKLHQESRLMIRDVKKKIRDEVKMMGAGGGALMGRYIDPNDTDNQVCKLIFSASCYAVLATFSVVIETSEFRTHIRECYSGYRACIKLAAHLGMDTECEAFVNSLYRFTLLGTLKGVRMKNVEAMKLLLEIGNNDGNLLRSSWKAVIKCCSEIDILHLMATQAPADGAFWLFNSNSKQQKDEDSNANSTKMGKRKASTSDDLMQSVRETGTANHESRKLGARTKVGSDGILRFQTNANAQLVSSHIDQNTVAKVFTGTEKLAPRAIIEFVTYLCEASSDEIMNHANPRSFCLQKIVDIAHFNLNRVRFEWIQLWAILSVHFEKAGCHRNQQICIYAIDNLKQLADKFLEREELTTFNFQKEFLKPFLTIVARTQLPDIREYIIQCIARLIKARYKNIKSGWKCVFGILGVAARVKDEHLVGTTFDIMCEILDLYFPMIAKMSTRPSNNANQSIFKIPETSTIDQDADATRSTTDDQHVVEHKIIDDEEEVDESKEAAAASAPASASAVRSNTNQIVYENEEQKQEHISKIQLLRIDAISDCVDTLLAFVANEFTDLSISAVDHISKVAQYLFESDQYLPQDMSGSSAAALMESDLMISIDTVVRQTNSSIFQFTSSMNGGKPDLSRPLIKAWFLCLLGLSKGVNDNRLEVRTHCLQVLFRLLRVQGEMFDNIMWQRVFERLLFPIFAELRQPSSSGSPQDNDNNATPPPRVPNISSTETPMPASFSKLSYDSIDVMQQQRKNSSKNLSNPRFSFGRRRSESVDYLANSFSFDDRIMSEDGGGGGQSLRRAQSMAINGTTQTIKKPVYDDYSWLETTCHPALSNLVELFHQFFFICHPILHDVVSLLCTFVIMKQSSDASQIGHQCLKRLIQALGPKLNATQWTIVIADLIISLKRTIPSQLQSDELRTFFNLNNEDEIMINRDAAAAAAENEQNGHEISIPKRVLNADNVSVLCTSQLLLIQTLAKITRQYLHKLSLYQCVDILNAFQISQDFITSCTKDSQLMMKLKYVKYKRNKNNNNKQQTPTDGDNNNNNNNENKNISNLIYKLESITFHCALNVLFQCKNASIKHLSQMNLLKEKIRLNVDENVESQIISTATNNNTATSNTPPPPTISNLRNMDEMIAQKSMPEPVPIENNKKRMNQIANHRMSVNDIRQLSEYRLIPLGIQLMQLMYVRERKQLRSANDTRYLVSVVSQFLKHLLSAEQFSDEQFNTKIRIIFPYLSRLCECQAIQIRELISKILLLRVSKCILLNQSQSKEKQERKEKEKKAQIHHNGSYHHLSPPFVALANKTNSV